MKINQIKTTILLAALTGLLLAIGAFFGGQIGIVMAFVVAIIMNVFSYFFCDKIALKIYRAKQIYETDNPSLFKIVKEISEKAKIPMPKVHIIPSNASNAFATGRNPNHASVAVTRGIMDLLTKEELKGVIAHEIAHIKNRDILISSIVATIAGAISFVAFMARWAAIFGGFGGDRDNNFLELIVLAILAPIIAMIIQLAISRSREYLADETGAKIVGSSNGLASALEKLEQDSKKHRFRFASKTSAHMLIINPFKASFIMSLFSTHPRVQDRVKKLNQISFN